MKKIFSTLMLTICAGSFLFAQNVGIGTSNPQSKLDVIGVISGSSNAYFDGSVGIGGTIVAPFPTTEKLRIQNGGIGFFNSTDSKTWLFNYSSGNNYFYLAEATGTTSFVRMVIANGGNVGIGNTAPSVKLHVTGSGRFTDNLAVDDNLTVDNNVTVDGGKGIIRNSTASQLRYQTFPAPFVMNLPAHGSLTANIVWNPFNSTPVAFVGNIVTSGGTTGELYRCILQLYNVTPTGCDCKIINTDNAPVNYNCTWNIVLIGN